MKDHYSKEELDMYRHRKMPGLSRIACAAHLRNCPECAAKLRELDDDDELVKRIRASLRTFAETDAPPASASSCDRPSRS